MIKYHGLCYQSLPNGQPGSIPYVYFGLCGIAQTVSNPGFHAGDNQSIEASKGLGLHTYNTLRKFVYSLNEFQQSMGELTTIINQSELNYPYRFSLEIRASIAADSILTYIGIITDNMARAILFAYKDGSKVYSQEIDSFSKLKNYVVRNNKYAKLLPLFSELNSSDSWHQQVLKRGTGARQRITHYTDYVQIQGSRPSGSNDPWMSNAVIISTNANHSSSTSDLSIAFTEIVADFFQWLDKLFDMLIEEISLSNPKKFDLHWDILNFSAVKLYADLPSVQSRGSVKGYLYIPEIPEIIYPHQ